VLVQVSELRGYMGLLAIKGGASELDPEVIGVRDAKDQLMAALDRNRGEAEKAIRTVRQRLVAAAMNTEHEELPEGLLETANLRRAQQIREENKKEKVPLPSRPPPEPPPPTSTKPTGPPSDLPGLVAAPGENLASLIERHSVGAEEGSAALDAEGFNDSWVDDAGTAGRRRPRSRGRTGMPAARSNKPASSGQRGGDWEEDFSKLLERGSWAPKDEADERDAESAQASPRRPRKASPKNTMENLLSGYLKEID